jgi:hypothetical protein
MLRGIVNAVLGSAARGGYGGRSRAGSGARSGFGYRRPARGRRSGGGDVLTLLRRFGRF